MSEVVLIMSLIQWARVGEYASKRLENQAVLLVKLWLAVGECGAYRAARLAFIRELKEAGRGDCLGALVPKAVSVNLVKH